MSLLVVGFEALTSFTLCLGQERLKATSIPAPVTSQIVSSQIRLLTWLTRPYQLFGCNKTQKPDAIRKFDREITTLQIELEWLRKEMKHGKRRKLKSRTKEELERSRFELEQV